MNEKQFIEEIAEIIETDASELTMESDFRESADFWSSLTGFSILIFMQDRCGVNIPVDDFLNMNTVADLYSTTVKEG
ncbi:acyl carrier protein [Cloacibacillus evryensis]|uniref:acyl carrier protein n=1 Tax=Cloacibacillus evryensis TaxID=508460 RepID=UPI00210ABA25|nr:acyl carrier protein [Cloacibacillus evryensis]MCQ4764175.1 acyl carrier protein [Cloacibacillus evryensis]